MPDVDQNLAPEEGKAEESSDEKNIGPVENEKEVQSESQKADESEDKKLEDGESEDKQHWDREKSEAYFQQQHQEEVERRKVAETELDRISGLYDIPPANEQKPVIENVPPVQGAEFEFDLNTPEGIAHLSQQIRAGVAADVNQVITLQEQKAEAQGRFNAESEQALRVFNADMAKAEVPKDVQDEALKEAIRDFPSARPAKIVKYAMRIAQDLAKVERTTKRNAEVEADVARKHKLKLENKPPPEGNAPGIKEGAAKPIESVIEKKIATKEGHEVL